MLLNFGRENKEMATTTLTKEELAKLPKELRERVEALANENTLLHKATEGKITFKVSEKGAVSVYGMGRWPVTLYKEQWARLLGASDALQDFIKANDGKLKTKLQAVAEGAEEGANGNGNGTGK